MGVQNRDPDKIVVAAESFEANGKLRHAEEAYVMAQLFGRDKLSVDEREAMLLKAVALAGTRGSPDRQTLYYGNLADLMDDAGRQDDSKRYAELRKALEG
jgi:hypothetical protein